MNSFWHFHLTWYVTSGRILDSFFSGKNQSKNSIIPLAHPGTKWAMNQFSNPTRFSHFDLLWFWSGQIWDSFCEALFDAARADEQLKPLQHGFCIHLLNLARVTLSRFGGPRLNSRGSKIHVLITLLLCRRIEMNWNWRGRPNSFFARAKLPSEKLNTKKTACHLDIRVFFQGSWIL